VTDRLAFCPSPWVAGRDQGVGMATSDVRSLEFSSDKAGGRDIQAAVNYHAACGGVSSRRILKSR